MKIDRPISLLILMLLLWSCSNTRFLADDEILYTGREKVEFIEIEQGLINREVKTNIRSVSDYKVNNSLLGKRILPPIGLWVHNYWDVDEDKAFGSWVHKTLSASPVLIKEVNPDLRAKKIESELFDAGYFKTNARAELVMNPRNPKKARITYIVEVSPPYVYNQILLDTLTEDIDTLIRSLEFKNRIIPGDQYNLDKLKDARSELSREIKNEGYFHFTPEYIELEADTALQKNMLNLYISRPEDLPREILSTYTIDNILINITHAVDTADTAPDTTTIGNISIVSPGDYVNPEILASAIYFTRGEKYSHTAYQNTISRLNNLGIFSYVRISFGQSERDSLLNQLDVTIDLAMAKNINLDFEADLVTKSTGYAGPEVLVGISNSNAFKGAEKVHLGLTGAFEWEWGNKTKTELGTFSYELGVKSGITVPKLILPSAWTINKALQIQETSVNLDFNLLNRTAYYKMFSSMTYYKYSWGRTRKIRHNYSPVYLNSVALMETTPVFDSVVNDNIYIRKSFEEQFIFGMRYDFIYDNTFINRPRNLLFQTSLNTSGNLIDVFAGMGKNAEDRPHLLLNTIYSQFVKLTTDFRYYFKGINQTFAFRFYAGIGIPYGNSSVLPYVEQFFSGGAYSVRGFTARYLGPGSYHEDKSGYIDQSGDLKLEGNFEYRFGISKIVKAALFLETGNIWLINEDENRPGSQFEINTFYKELAVGSGLGLRFDFNFFVLRTDLGFPLRNPYLTDGKNWLPGTKDILSGAHFYLAIGYPF